MISYQVPPWLISIDFPRDIMWQVSVFGKGEHPKGSGPNLDGDVPSWTDRNEAVTLAHAKSGVGNNTGGTPPLLQIQRVTKCIISYCARNYTISVFKGVPSLNISEAGWGRLF
jgi:hypothetical protein